LNRAIPFTKTPRSILVLGGGLSKTTTKIPELIGLNLEQAENKLAQYSLNLGGLNYDENPEIENDTIVPFIWKQKPDPESGAKLNLGDLVDVWFTIDSIKLPWFDTTTIDEDEDLSTIWIP
jgi:beta-lactam-binding protein with PASTA domain